MKQFSDLTKEHFIVVLLGLFMAAGIGFSYATGNQHTYLIDGLRLINPELLKFDWFATQTTHYHGSFGWLLWGIEKIMPLPIGTVLLNTLLIILSIWALLSIIKQYWSRPVFIVLASFNDDFDPNHQRWRQLY